MFPSTWQRNCWARVWVFVLLTFVSLQLIFGHGICAAIKVFLKRVHLSAQDISERLHLCQLLCQAVTLLKERKKKPLVSIFLWTTSQPFQCRWSDQSFKNYSNNSHASHLPHVCRYKAEANVPLSECKWKTHFEGGCGGGRVAAGGWCEWQHGAVAPKTGLWAISRISLRREPKVRWGKKTDVEFWNVSVMS